MTLPTWHVQPDTEFDAITADELRVLAHGTHGEVTLADHSGQVIWTTDRTYPAKAVALGARHVFSVHSLAEREWTLRATRFEGDVAWETRVHAARISRIFADRRSRVVILANREGAFRVDVHSEENGARRHSRVLDRRRGLADRIARRVWTRDDEGCTEFDLPAGSVAKTGLAGNGPMTAYGAELFTVISPDTLVCVGDGRVQWSAPFGERDLTALARDEEMLDEGEDTDLWPAELGRPFVGPEQVLVADLSGRLHALDKATGSAQWSFESAHYPSSTRAAMPSAAFETIAYPASDEHLYLLGMDGRERARFDLQTPFEASATILPGGVVLLPGAGIRAFV